ncbi:hypothetical protein [Endozoicomonas sp.]|uniref:hypothetical protein n=1 Tax=Endozoicomonas sp. TaxID=1892382 RepID=UPI00383B71FD
MPNLIENVSGGDCSYNQMHKQLTGVETRCLEDQVNLDDEARSDVITGSIWSRCQGRYVSTAESEGWLRHLKEYRLTHTTIYQAKIDGKQIGVKQLKFNEQIMSGRIIDMDMDAIDMKDFRRSPDFKNKNVKYRIAQHRLFKAIKRSLSEEVLSSLSGKSSAAIMVKLLGLDAFTEEELLIIWSELGKELDSSPFW